MLSSRVSLRLLVGAVIAVLLSALVMALWRSAVARNDATGSLKWARQIAAQAEGMAFSARARGDADPIGQAVAALSQGGEPRAMRVWKVTGLSSSERESFSLHQGEGVFEYVKLLTLENGTGVRVRIQVERRGIFGLPAGGASDLATFILFGLFWIPAHTLLGRLRSFQGSWTDRASRETSDPEGYEGLVEDYLLPAGEELARLERLRTTEDEMRDALVRTGGSVRDLLRSTKALLAGSSRSKSAVSLINSRIHADLRELSDSRRAAVELSRSAIDTELASLHTLVEGTRRETRDPAQVLALSAQVHEAALRVRALNEKVQRALSRIEVEMEPFATDSDLALVALSDALEGASRLDEQIRSTAESLVRQARILKKFESDLNEKGGEKRVPSRALAG